MYVPPEALPGNQPQPLTEADIDKWLEYAGSEPDQRFKVIELTNQSNLTSHELQKILNSKIPKGYRVIIAIDAIHTDGLPSALRSKL